MRGRRFAFVPSILLSLDTKSEIKVVFRWWGYVFETGGRYALLLTVEMCPWGMNVIDNHSVTVELWETKIDVVSVTLGSMIKRSLKISILTTHTNNPRRSIGSKQVFQ